MGLFDAFRRPVPETKESKVGAVLWVGGGEPVWTKRDYAAFAKEAYQENVIGYQAITKVAEAVGAVDWEVWRGEQVLAAHPVIKLLRRPNPMQSLAELMHAKVSYLLLSGNYYDERVTVGTDIRELYTHRPDRMTVIPGDNGMPRQYVYKVGGRPITWDVDDSGKCDLRQNKRFHPLDDWYGLSAVEPAAYSVDQHNEAMGWMMALLQNSARPSGALVAEAELGAEAFARLKSDIEAQYSGAANAGRPMLLENGLDWKAMGLSPTDMGIVDACNAAARNISLAYGVPPQMLGIPGDSTYANYEQARLAFWEETVSPLVNFIADDWSSWFGEIYPGIEIKPNLDAIPAIADKRKKLWEMADKSLDLTIDERRELKGFPPLGDDRGAKLAAELRQSAPPQTSDGLTPDLIKALAYGAG